MAKPRVTYHSNGKTRTKAEMGLSELRWWKAPEKEMAATIHQTVKAIRDEQTVLRARFDEYARLYENVGNGMGAKARPSDMRGRLTLNVIRSCITTAAAKIASNKPRPLILTTKGDWEQQDKAEKLTRYSEGMFKSSGIYAEMVDVVIDSMVYGTGALRIFIDGVEPEKDDEEDLREIRCERAMVTELVIDEREARYGKPCQLHQIRLMSKDQCLALFGDTAKRRAAIEEVEPLSVTELQGSGLSMSEHVIAVIESWHLPSRRGAKDGRHAMSLNSADGLLLSEEYTKDCFPFIFYRWQRNLSGFWGMGLAEELQGVQREITSLLRDIADSQKIACVPRVFVEEQAKINKSQLTNRKGGIVTYTGTPPVIGTASAMPAEIYLHLERLIQKAYEITGVSQADAASRKPAGVESAVAIREVNDIASSRFILQGQRLEEEAYMAAAEIMLDLSRDLFTGSEDVKGKKTLAVKAVGRRGKFIESIPWSDVDMKRDQYTMQVFPVSQLPRTPSGRIQTVTELMQMTDENGKPLMTGAQAWKMLDMPDYEDQRDFDPNVQALGYTKMLIDGMLSGRPYVAPEKFMNLDLAVRMAQGAIMVARQEKVPERWIDNVYQFMEDAAQMLAPPPSPAPPTVPLEAAPPDAGMMPPGPPPGLPPEMPPGPPAGPEVPPGPIPPGIMA